MAGHTQPTRKSGRLHKPGALETPGSQSPNHSLESRKRDYIGLDEPTSQQPLKRARLTTKNLKVLTREVVPPSMPFGKRSSSGQSSVKSSSRSSGNTATTDLQFRGELSKNGIIHAAKKPPPPADLAIIMGKLDRHRESPAASPSTYRRFEIRVAHPHTEDTTHAYFWPKISKNSDKRDSDYWEFRNIAWNLIDNHLTSKLSHAKPDIIEAFLEDAYPAAIRDAMPEMIPGQYGFAMPSFACEVKSAQRSLMEAITQCAYDGALMVHSAFELHKHIGEDASSFYNKTKAITVAFNGSDVSIYAHYARPILSASSARNRRSNDIQVEYCQYKLKESTVSADLEGYNLARKHVRNAQDIGHEIARSLLDRLNAHADRTIAGHGAPVQLGIPSMPSGSSTAQKAKRRVQGSS